VASEKRPNPFLSFVFWEHKTMTSSPSQNPDEPSGLLHTLAIVFSGFLFGFFLSKLKAPIQDSAEPIHPQDSTGNRKTEAKPPLPVAVTIESYPPPTVSEEEKANKGEEKFLKRGNFVAGCITALITMGILCVTWNYTNYAKGQLDGFKQSQRAILIMKVYAITDSVERGKPLNIHCTITNIGLTAATNIGISEGGGGGDATPWIIRGRYRVPVVVSSIPTPSDAGEPPLGPNQDRDCGRTVSAIDQKVLLENKWYASFTISVSYRDVFQQPWILNDCLMITPEEDKFSRCSMTTTYIKPFQNQ
jgi:hypothetical protein